jgi:ribosomal RNA-processing protein 9
VTPTHIYSCSKDKSIIQWDRETKKKTFISLGKDPLHHRSEILCLALHSSHNVLATAGDDCMIKLWDTRSSTLIDTFHGHKNTINGLKFGPHSHNLCSASADLTLKHWDFSQRGLIGTYYEHTSELLDLDYFNSQDFITSGYDRQVIAWKTEKETKVVFKGHHYAIDRVRTINLERFITACQDGSIYLWSTKKTKPTFKLPNAHPKGWISAMDNIKQSNLLATAGIDRTVKVWAIEGDHSGLKLLKEIPVNGIVTDLKLTWDYLAVTECDELRLGRWVTDKCRNKVKIFPLRAPASQLPA